MWEICFSRNKDWRAVIDWADIESELDRIDSENHTYFNLSEDGVRYMKVYGSHQNRVVVEFSNVILSDQYQLLYDPTQTKTTSVMIKEWHWGNLPPEICVDKALAKRVLKHFYETQEQLKGVIWGPWPLLWILQINRDRQPVHGWNEIELAIDLMNNSEYAYIGLGFENDTERAMEVYGGDQGRMYLTYTDQNEGFDAVLVDRTQTQSVRLLNGLYQEYFEHLPPHHCVDKMLAKRALKHFFGTKEQDKSLDWQEGPWPNLILEINQTHKIARDWVEIERAIDQMDNDKHAYVSLGAENGECAVWVYGGNQGRVHVTYSADGDEIRFVLIDHTQTESVPLLHGLSQQFSSDLLPQHCIDRVLAKRALKHFFETQTRDKSLQWYSEKM